MYISKKKKKTVRKNKCKTMYVFYKNIHCFVRYIEVNILYIKTKRIHIKDTNLYYNIKRLCN